MQTHYDTITNTSQNLHNDEQIKRMLDDRIEIHTDDIYKEFLLRGYEYGALCTYN